MSPKFFSLTTLSPLNLIYILFLQHSSAHVLQLATFPIIFKWPQIMALLKKLKPTRAVKATELSNTGSLEKRASKLQNVSTYAIHCSFQLKLA